MSAASTLPSRFASVPQTGVLPNRRTTAGTSAAVMRPSQLASAGAAGVGLGVSVADGRDVDVNVGVCVLVAVLVGVSLGIEVVVGENVGAWVIVGVWVLAGVCVLVGVALRLGVGVIVGVAVMVGVDVGGSVHGAAGGMFVHPSAGSHASSVHSWPSLQFSNSQNAEQLVAEPGDAG